MATTATLNAGAARASTPSKAAESRMAGPVSLVFVVGEKGSYEGFVRLSSLARAHAGDLVDGMIEGKDLAVRRELDQEQAARQLQMKDVALLPVVDGGNVLVGVLTFDDAMDVLEVETSDDISYKAGVGDMFNTTDHVRSEKLTQGPIWYAVRVRILFLMVTLIGGLLVGGLIVTFEDVLGFLLPWAMVKIGLDHAPGVNPFITTIKDFSGLAVYLLMASWLIGIEMRAAGRSPPPSDEGGPSWKRDLVRPGAA